MPGKYSVKSYNLSAFRKLAPTGLSISGVSGCRLVLSYIDVYIKLVDCLEKCLIYGHIRRFAD